MRPTSTPSSGSRSTTTRVHIQIITNIALKLCRLLVKHGVELSLVRDYRLEPDDSEVVVVLSALLHDIGMSIHRRDHEDWSPFSQSQRCELLGLASTASPS